jgi:hypothetical protein
VGRKTARLIADVETGWLAMAMYQLKMHALKPRNREQARQPVLTSA